MAGLVFQIDTQSENIKQLCHTYLVGDDRSLDIQIGSFQDHKSKYRSRTILSDFNSEQIYIYREVAQSLIPYQGLVLHASVVEVDGVAFGFAGRSGIGKSTQTRLLKARCGERCRIVNGDKPIIRLHREQFYAYGTPWCGKEGWQENRGVPLRGLIFLERGGENRLFPMSNVEILARLLPQIILPENNEEEMDICMGYVDKLISGCFFARLVCDMSGESAGLVERYIKEQCREDQI